MSTAPDPTEDPAELSPVDPIDLTDEDREALNEAEADAQPVTYSGTDFDVEGLVRRLTRGDIVIPTFGHDLDQIETARFQRSFVWSRPQMDRFIESLLLEYPIPGIILVQQADKRYLVLDGQQRLRTLAAFYSGIHNGKEFALQNVADRFENLTYNTLSAEQKRTLDNTFIQSTIVRTDGSPGSLDAVYQVFERLNAGGTQLTPHEIRVALYAGPFVDLLADLNDVETWRALYGNKSPRLRDQELVLRIVALYVSAQMYKRPLKQFLNDFVRDHRDLRRFPADVVADRFRGATKLLLDGPGRAALRYQSNQVNAALSEALVVGLMRRLDLGPAPRPEIVSAKVAELTSNDALVSAIVRATADEESVRVRLAEATSAFSAV